MNILVIGGTGMLGKPVVRALVKSGHEVTVLCRKPTQDFDPSVRVLVGDIKSASDINIAMKDQDVLHLNLSIKPTEKEKDWHTEAEGLDLILAAAKTANIKRISYLSSIVHFYQGLEGFDWWVFRVKQAAVQKIKSCGIPSVIFYPSAFMESIVFQSKQGKNIAVGGHSAHKMWYIAADDYARQVAAALSVSVDISEEFYVQGPEAFSQKEAAQCFIKNYTKETLKVMWAPMWFMKALGFLSQKMNYGYHIVTALNRYPEAFKSETTWQKLGKPEMTLSAFATKLSS